MSVHSDPKSVHKTLTGTTADAVTITGNDAVDVCNWSTSERLYFRSDGQVAVAKANGTECVGPGGYVRHDADNRTISLVGDGNDYSVVGFSP
jgi:hypothetical protein